MWEIFVNCTGIHIWCFVFRKLSLTPALLNFQTKRPIKLFPIISLTVCSYPSGNVAVLITSTEEKRYTYIVLKVMFLLIVFLFQSFSQQKSFKNWYFCHRNRLNIVITLSLSPAWSLHKNDILKRTWHTYPYLDQVCK